MKDNIQSFDSAASYCGELKYLLEKLPESKKATVQEIRLRSGKPLTLTDGKITMFVSNDSKILYTAGENAVRVTQRNIYDTFKSLCSYSVYSRQNEIKSGYITVKGGHRVGLCGTAVVKDGEVTAINDISSLNIRIARQIFGASEELFEKAYSEGGGILIAGLPSSGKTTVLRDMAYRLSLGIDCHVMRTAVIDERGELSGTYGGTAENDLGLCDVLNGYPKGEGIIQAIRSLSPQVIICDEVGTESDAAAISAGANAGADIIATIHAGSYDELLRRKQARRLLETGAFKTVVILESADRPGKVSEVVHI